MALTSEYHQMLLGFCGSVRSQSSWRVWLRAAQRTAPASSAYEPPRTTNSSPSAGPFGFRAPSGICA